MAGALGPARVPSHVIAGSALTNPFSSGGGGTNFENSVQTMMAVLMLTGGFAPCLSPMRITKIILQGRYEGYETDDCVVFAEDRATGESAKLLAQIKHTVAVTKAKGVFGDAVGAAWRDFNNTAVFTRGRDALALITGPLSATDTEHARTIPEWARASATADEFFTKINKLHFSSAEKQTKLEAFRTHVETANAASVSDEQLWQFLKHYHLVGYDLDVTSGVTLSLLNSHLGQFSIPNVAHMFGAVGKFVGSMNQSAGTIDLDNVPHDIRSVFVKPLPQATMPVALIQPPPTHAPTVPLPAESATAVASLLGGWDERAEGDQQVIKELIEGDDKK